MPELPEVETMRLRMDKVLRRRRLAKVIVDREDFICFDQAEPDEVARKLRGARVTGSDRRGKYLWLELDRRPWLVLHFGMTGNIEIRMRKQGKTQHLWGWGGEEIWAERHRQDWTGKLPRFCRILLITDDGTEVAFTDPRRFGRIRLADDPLHSPPIDRLGADPLHRFPTARQLYAVLQKRRTPIKAALLDQTIFAGVGNWIADEVLYQAGISPHRAASQLSPETVAGLRRKLLAILRKAVAVDADYSRYPKSWLFHYRWGKEKNARNHRQAPILHETIGGRTTAWVPEVQR